MSDIKIIVDRQTNIQLTEKLRLIEANRSERIPDTYLLDENIRLDFLRLLDIEPRLRFKSVSEAISLLRDLRYIECCLDLRDGRAIVEKISGILFPKKNFRGATHVLLPGSLIQEVPTNRLLVPCLCVGTHFNLAINYVGHDSIWRKGYAIAYFAKELRHSQLLLDATESTEPL